MTFFDVIVELASFSFAICASRAKPSRTTVVQEVVDE